MENKNAFKHWINHETVNTIANAIQEEYPPFNSKEFSKIAPALKSLELKARVLEITKELKKHLPEDYSKTSNILIKVIQKSNLKGFNLWPFSEYISQFGTTHVETSLKAMEVLTEKFTSEFAIRPFLLQHNKQVLEFLDSRTEHDNVHIRRWVSEGTRPYLPWGQKVPLIADQPELTLNLLNKLKHDEELYVRKSVANHLNDHSKKHPNLVVQTLQRWEKEAPEKHQSKIEWIKRHALRTLIKKGHPNALKLMGVNHKVQIKLGKIKLLKKNFKINDKLGFEFDIESQSNKAQKVIMDYGIGFVKSNGKTATKIFKLKTFMLQPKEKITVRKAHSLKKITTMKYYPGKHQIKIQINGNILSHASWNFLIQ
jgi:3-methyladenine DNA glycosylase AlkC